MDIAMNNDDQNILDLLSNHLNQRGFISAVVVNCLSYMIVTTIRPESQSVVEKGIQLYITRTETQLRELKEEANIQRC